MSDRGQTAFDPMWVPLLTILIAFTLLLVGESIFGIQMQALQNSGTHTLCGGGFGCGAMDWPDLLPPLILVATGVLLLNMPRRVDQDE